MARMPVSERVGPTDPGARLRSVDAVRGFALFGVLLVNMYNFGAYAPEWTGFLDRAFSTWMHALLRDEILAPVLDVVRPWASQCSWPRHGRHESGSLWFYFRRLAILFVFGMVHALFYDGDILMEYAMLGVILVAFRDVRSPGAARSGLYVLLAAIPARQSGSSQKAHR